MTQDDVLGFPASLRLCERIFFWVVILKIKASPRGRASHNAFFAWLLKFETEMLFPLAYNSATYPFSIAYEI